MDLCLNYFRQNPNFQFHWIQSRKLNFRQLSANDATLLGNNSQHCRMLHAVCVCTPCCLLLLVVAQSLRPGKLLAPCKRTQYCWELLRPFARNLCVESDTHGLIEPLRGDHADECKCSCLYFSFVCYILIPSSLTR